MSSSKPVLHVLDDDAAVRSLIRRVGEGCGFRTEAFADPVDFLTAVAADRPELIILDIVLGQTGWTAVLEALSRLRCTAPIIVSSGIDERLLGSAVRIGEKLGLTMVVPLPKPAGPAELSVAISAAGRIGQPICAAELDHAIAAGEIVPHYQPKLRIADRKPAGVEALARWEHPARGTLGPAVFLPLAEKSSAIMRLTELMVERAAADCAAWQAAGHDVSVAVNIPAHCLAKPGFADRVAALVAKAGAQPASVMLEITESAARADTPVVAAALAGLSGHGFPLSIDDFGTGCSSLAQLHRLPFQELKIDRSFVSGMLHDREGMVITRTVIGMARKLGLRSVAEGVEDQDVMDALDQMGCDIAQGFLIGRAMPAGQLLDWLDRGAVVAQPALPVAFFVSPRRLAA